MLATNLLSQLVTIKRAIEEPGQNPAMHDTSVKNLQRGWPLLWANLRTMRSMVGVIHYVDPCPHDIIQRVPARLGEMRQRSRTGPPTAVVLEEVWQCGRCLGQFDLIDHQPS